MNLEERLQHLATKINALPNIDSIHRYAIGEMRVWRDFTTYDMLYRIYIVDVNKEFPHGVKFIYEGTFEEIDNYIELSLRTSDELKLRDMLKDLPEPHANHFWEIQTFESLPPQYGLYMSLKPANPLYRNIIYRGTFEEVQAFMVGIQYGYKFSHKSGITQTVIGSNNVTLRIK